MLRNPVLFLLLIVLAGATYIAYSLNLLGPMMQMGNAAWGQGLDIGKAKLREFLENNETARQAIGVPAAVGGPSGGEGRRRQGSDVSLDSLDSRGKKKGAAADGAADDI